MTITEIDNLTGEETEMSPESYAALWGCDAWGPSGADGAYFYNFAVQGHDPEFLTSFLPVIDRQIKRIEESIKAVDKDPKHDYGWTQDDLDNMGLLYDYVQELLEETLV